MVDNFPITRDPDEQSESYEKIKDKVTLVGIPSFLFSLKELYQSWSTLLKNPKSFVDFITVSK